MAVDPRKKGRERIEQDVIRPRHRHGTTQVLPETDLLCFLRWVSTGSPSRTLMNFAGVSSAKLQYRYWTPSASVPTCSRSCFPRGVR
jgi:hypothetical protein